MITIKKSIGSGTSNASKYEKHRYYFDEAKLENGVT